MTTETVLSTEKKRISPRTRAKYIRWAQYAVFVVIVAVIAFVADWGMLQDAFLNPRVLNELDFSLLFRAFFNTVIYTALGFTLALFLGLSLALMRLSDVLPYRWFATVYIEFFRGVPALLVFLTFGLGIPLAFGTLVPLLATVTLALGLVGSAYIAETVRAGIQAVPKGQIEAARSLGMGPTQTMISVVIPQAFRIILPPLTNELILLTKDSSLVYIVGLATTEFELTHRGKSWMNTEANLTPILLVGFAYLIITVPLGRLVTYLEHRQAKAR